MSLTESKYNALKKGDAAPDFFLLGADGKHHPLKSFKNAKAILIVFMCNHCPYVKVKLPELNRIAKDFKDEGLAVVGINSNESEGYPEDNFENMKHLVQKGGVEFTYLHDETQKVAKAYGAVCTPDPFLFDHNLKLIFHSRIDNPPGLDDAEKHELYDTIQEFLETGKISAEEKPSMGCNIKWK
jgi:peroxiredoxin